MESTERQPTFQRNLLLPSSGFKNKPYVDFLFALFFDPEDGDDIFIQNFSYFQWTTQCYILEGTTVLIVLFVRFLIVNSRQFQLFISNYI
jgi:hypothetical protein